jgi:hypothetical protein
MNHKSNFEAGTEYKQAVTEMAGGYGKYAWNSSTYLFFNEHPMWLRICELSFKNIGNNGTVHINRYSFRKYFLEDGKDYVDGTLNSLEQIGYISFNYDDEGFINIRINYDVVKAATVLFGKDRSFAIKLRRECQILNENSERVDKHILSITPSEILKARSL